MKIVAHCPMKGGEIGVVYWLKPRFMKLTLSRLYFFNFFNDLEHSSNPTGLINVVTTFK